MSDVTIESILMPLTFVGLGMILYGIGMQLHLMHLMLSDSYSLNKQTSRNRPRRHETNLKNKFSVAHPFPLT